MQIGHIVRLKSDGPDMTMMFLGTKGRPTGPKIAVCEWFYEGKLCKETFLQDSVAPVDTNPIIAETATTIGPPFGGPISL